MPPSVATAPRAAQLQAAASLAHPCGYQAVHVTSSLPNVRSHRHTPGRLALVRPRRLAVAAAAPAQEQLSEQQEESPLQPFLRWLVANGTSSSVPMLSCMLGKGAMHSAAAAVVLLRRCLHVQASQGPAAACCRPLAPCCHAAAGVEGVGAADSKVALYQGEGGERGVVSMAPIAGAAGAGGASWPRLRPWPGRGDMLQREGEGLRHMGAGAETKGWVRTRLQLETC